MSTLSPAQRSYLARVSKPLTKAEARMVLWALNPHGWKKPRRSRQLEFSVASKMFQIVDPMPTGGEEER